MPISVLQKGLSLGERLKVLREKLNSNAVLSVGFLESGGIDDEQTTYPNGMAVAQVAFWQEFGAPKAGIPPRPFFRNAITKNTDKWGDTLVATMRATDFQTAKALRGLGQVIKQDIQDSIVNFSGTELSDVTLMLRLMKKLNTTHPFKTKNAFAEGAGVLSRRVQGDGDIVITGKTVGIAYELVQKGFSAAGKVSSKPLIEPTAGNTTGGVMLAGVDYRVDDR